MGGEDEDVVGDGISELENKGIGLYRNVERSELSCDNHDRRVDSKVGKFEGDGVVLGIGGKGNRDLGLENSDMELGERGEIKVNGDVERSVRDIYGGGDVKGGVEFRYISLEHYRIMK
ncbi:FAD-dependent oxidoreductase [Staphylococcus aureus]|uniref:FAD-dependent oxidoreductase n=1 Tax=Staphylococcus aureus TaxID=1280 RepID=UPI0021B3C11B|nr:FAD-dependent oxidoreductase [Staphylococcus aureus]